jgi:dTDP-4-amino-4,6-dideoxygalactose transaminase
VAQLAINGGAKAAEASRFPSWPIPGEGERRLVDEVLQSGRWGGPEGDKIDRFEQAFAAYQGTKPGVAVANGTVALELALLVAGVRPLDEVIVPAVSFVASATAIVRVGAVPVFVDSDPETLAIAPGAFEAAIGERTTAAVCVHYGGYPVDFDAILPVAKRRGIAIVEDCAHAQGTQWRGMGAGAIGTIGAMSFQASKSLTLGEGGVVTTDDDALAERARLMLRIGRRPGRPGYEHAIVASNYRLTEIQAAIGLGQLELLPDQVRQRQAAQRFLVSELAKIGGLSALKPDPRISRRGFYFLVLRYDSRHFAGLPRDRFVDALRAEGVPCGIGYGMPLYRQPAFGRDALEPFYPRGTRLPDYATERLPVAEEFCANQQVTIPHPVLLADDAGLQSILDAVAKIKVHAEELLVPAGVGA